MQIVRMLVNLTCPSGEFKVGDIVEDEDETLIMRGLAELVEAEAEGE